MSKQTNEAPIGFISTESFNMAVRQRDLYFAKSEDEKRARIYYQNIVYNVCNSLDVVAGEMIVCGNATEPSDDVQKAARTLVKDIALLRRHVAQKKDYETDIEGQAEVYREVYNLLGAANRFDFAGSGREAVIQGIEALIAIKNTDLICVNCKTFHIIDGAGKLRALNESDREELREEGRQEIRKQWNEQAEKLMIEAARIKARLDEATERERCNLQVIENFEKEIAFLKSQRNKVMDDLIAERLSATNIALEPKSNFAQPSTPTPRTDKMTGAILDRSFVDAGFARTLETELDEAISICEDYCNLAYKFTSAADGMPNGRERILLLGAERDSLRSKLAAAEAKLEFLKAKGLTVGMMKTSDKPDPYLAYVIEPESELSDSMVLRKLIDADIALHTAKAKVKELEERREAAKKLQRMTEDNQIRWMQLHEKSEHARTELVKALGFCIDRFDHILEVWHDPTGDRQTQHLRRADAWGLEETIADIEQNLPSLKTLTLHGQPETKENK